MNKYLFNFISLILLISTLAKTSSAIKDRSKSKNNQIKEWGQLGNIITAEEDSMYDGMGHSVALSEDGKIVAVGAPYLANNAGKVIVQWYDSKDQKWRRMGSPLFGLEHEDYFGFDVAINAKGDALVVSSPAAYERTGMVAVYRWDDYEQDWEQVGDFLQGQYDREEFGFAVAMSETGDYIAIGAPYAAGKPGRVEVYQYGNNEWLKVGTDIQGETNDDEAGETIDILEHGKDLYVAVGAPLDLESEGSATVFKLSTDQADNDDWKIMNRYVDGDDLGTGFGQSVSLGHDGTNVILAVGFPGPGIDENSDPLSGVQVYSISPTFQWKYHGKMIFPVQRGDDTGEKVSLSRDGKTIAIASPEYDGGKGLVRVFKLVGDKYTQIGGDMVADENEELGYSMSLSKDGKAVSIGSISGRYVVTYAIGHKDLSATRSALGIITMTFLISLIVAGCGWVVYRYIGYFSSFGRIFTSVSTTEPSGTQMMTFPVHSPGQGNKGSIGQLSESDDDEDDDGISFAGDEEDYETHLNATII